MREYKELAKLRSSFGGRFAEYVHPKRGRIQADVMVAGTRSGRWVTKKTQAAVSDECVEKQGDRRSNIACRKRVHDDHYVFPRIDITDPLLSLFLPGDCHFSLLGLLVIGKIRADRPLLEKIMNKASTVMEWGLLSDRGLTIHLSNLENPHALHRSQSNR